MYQALRKALPYLIVTLLVWIFPSEADESSRDGDVCDLSLLYSGRYQYSFPRDLLELFLSGKAFDHDTYYTADESSRLREDIREIHSHVLSKNPQKGNLAVLTAGAPGTGKTTQLRQDLAEKERNGQVFAYVCPDDVCLKNLVRTFQCDIENSDGSLEAHQRAYQTWRPGSNAAAHLILGNLIRQHYSFYFGTALVLLKASGSCNS